MCYWCWYLVGSTVSNSTLHNIHVFHTQWFCYKKLWWVTWDSSCDKSWVPVKKASPKLKMFGTLCDQTFNLKTDSKTLHCSILKSHYSPSLNNSQNNSDRNYRNRILLHIHMLRSIDLCILWDAHHELFCIFGDFYASGPSCSSSG